MWDLLAFSALASGALGSPHTIRNPRSVFPGSYGNGGALNVLDSQLEARDELLGSATGAIGVSPEEQWFEQKLDHFSGGNGTTWRQKFYEADVHFHPGGPVFLVIGGEGPLSPNYVGSRYLNGYLAEKFQGATLAIEHRFYGKSQPLPDLSDLSLLTSQQALADVAHFRRAIGGEDSKYAKSKFICMGGSYPGALSAWFRQKYPDLVEGCLAFSAPIFAKTDFFEFGQMVYRALGEPVAGRLLNGYRGIVSELRMGTPAAREAVLRTLKACPYSVLSNEDFANVEDIVTCAAGYIVQYNNTAKAATGGKDIEQLRGIVSSVPAGSDEDVAWAVTEWLAPAIPPRLAVDSESDAIRTEATGSGCIDYSLRYFFETQFPTSHSDPNAASRAWIWQTCNEFGYFQTARDGGPEKRTLYTDGVSNSALWQGLCENIYGVSDTESRVERTREFYAEERPTRTIFVNGEFDTWAPLGRNWEQSVEGDELYSYVVPNGSHCVGLYGNPEAQDLLPGAVEVQRKIVGTLQRWLGTSGPVGEPVEQEQESILA